MSAPELPARPSEDAELETARPSVTITKNAKGDTQFTVKVYGLDASDSAAINAAFVAQGIYDQLTEKYGSDG